MGLGYTLGTSISRAHSFACGGTCMGGSISYCFVGLNHVECCRWPLPAYTVALLGSLLGLCLPIHSELLMRDQRMLDFP